MVRLTTGLGGIFMNMTNQTEKIQQLDPVHGHKGSDPNSETTSYDWPSLLMIAVAIGVSIYSFWPEKQLNEPHPESIREGVTAPGLWALDLKSRQIALGLLPRGWFVWVVLAPAHSREHQKLDIELPALQKQWQTMADIERWRRVIVVADTAQGNDLLAEDLEPAQIPLEIVLGTSRTWASWGAADRVRHILIEPTGRILLIEPGESDQKGSLKKIAEDLRRRLQRWEGEFDDLPRFSQAMIESDFPV